MPPPHRPAILAVLALSTAGLFAETEPTLKLPKYLVEESSVGNSTSSAVLDSNNWRGRAITTLGDAIGRAPGLLLQESFGGFEPPRLSIRGSGVQSAPSSRGMTLTIDGLPINLADGSFNSACFAPQIASQIEVSRGLDAWSSSPATMGGSIDLSTREALPNIIHAEAGSFGALHANASGVQQGPEILTLAAGLEQQDGYRDHSQQRRRLFSGSINRQHSNKEATAISVFWIQPEYNVPGPLTLTAATSAPRSVSSDVIRDQPRREAELTRIAITTQGQTSHLRYNGGAAFQHGTDWFRQLQASGISDSRSDDLSLHASLSEPFEIASLSNQLHAETSATRGWRSLKRFVNNAGLTDSRFGRDGLYATTASFAVKDTIELWPSLTTTAGYSHVYASRDIVDRQPAITTTTLNQNHTANLSSFDLQWTPLPGQTIFIRIYQSDEPATFDDLLFVAGSFPNLNRRSQSLLSQRATTKELGTRGQLGKFNWTVTAYHSEWRNEILRLADANGQPRGAANAGPTLHQGIESSVHWRIFDYAQRLTLSLQSVLSRITFDNDPINRNNKLAGIPPCIGSAELFYEHPRGFFAGSSLNWTAGRTPVDHAGRLSYGGHTLAGLRTGWRHGKTWTLYAEARNIFNHQHIASTAGVLDLARNPAATAVFLPGNGRSITAGLEWSP